MVILNIISIYFWIPSMDFWTPEDIIFYLPKHFFLIGMYLKSLFMKLWIILIESLAGVLIRFFQVLNIWIKNLQII